jgi:hypothetical protein
MITCKLPINTLYAKQRWDSSDHTQRSNHVNLNIWGLYFDINSKIRPYQWNEIKIYPHCCATSQRQHENVRSNYARNSPRTQSINQQLTCNKASFPNKSYRLDIARPLHRNSTEQITRGISWRNRVSSWLLLFYLFIQWRRLSAHDPFERIKHKKVFWIYHVWRISKYSISENCVVFVRFNGNKAEAGYVAC